VRRRGVHSPARATRVPPFIRGVEAVAPRPTIIAPGATTRSRACAHPRPTTGEDFVDREPPLPPRYSPDGSRPCYSPPGPPTPAPPPPLPPTPPPPHPHITGSFPSAVRTPHFRTPAPPAGSRPPAVGLPTLPPTPPPRKLDVVFVPPTAQPAENLRSQEVRAATAPHGSHVQRRGVQGPERPRRRRPRRESS